GAGGRADAAPRGRASGAVPALGVPPFLLDVPRRLGTGPLQDPEPRGGVSRDPLGGAGLRRAGLPGLAHRMPPPSCRPFVPPLGSASPRRTTHATGSNRPAPRKER